MSLSYRKTFCRRISEINDLVAKVDGRDLKGSDCSDFADIREVAFMLDRVDDSHIKIIWVRFDAGPLIVLLSRNAFENEM